MPAGIEIMIAIENPKAMIINNVLIFLLETFLTALVKAPKRFTFAYILHLIQKKGSGKQLILASFHRDWDSEPSGCSLLPSPSFGCNVF
jgi:hypothetical protein